MPFTIVRNDITKMQVDAIVNAANTELQMGAGVCGAIFRAAGERELQSECKTIGGCQTGQAVITGGYRLPARYIIHTPGPVWRGGAAGEEELLGDCYRHSLALARLHDCESIAFPLISSGLYGFPKTVAMRAASGAIRTFLQQDDMDVYLVLFDKAAVEVGETLLVAVEAFIDEHYAQVHEQTSRKLLRAERAALRPPDEALEEARSAPQTAAPPGELEMLVGRLDEPFAEALLRLIDAKGQSDVDVYKRANIDRKLFSKIRTNKAYIPSKRTAVAFAVALELSVEETADLLERAGYALSRSQKFDVIIEYFIRSGNYDLYAINEVLFHYDQPLLGA